MKESEFARKVSKYGCYITEHGSRHDEWYSPVTGEYVRVPRHKSKELKTGLADKLLKKLLGHK